MPKVVQIRTCKVGCTINDVLFVFGSQPCCGVIQGVANLPPLSTTVEINKDNNNRWSKP
jgi:hypothetical protein